MTPTAIDLDDFDDNNFGNETIVTDHNSQTKDESEGKPYIIKNSKEQGYIYDGKSMGISGKYNTAYTTYKVSEELGSLVFKYDSKFYKIVKSKKLEKWEDHEISDSATLIELRKLK